MSADNDKKRGGKRRYVGGRGGKRFKGSRELEVGMQGVLITCNMNEGKCTSEAYNLLGEYADQLYGPEKVTRCQRVSTSGPQPGLRGPQWATRATGLVVLNRGSADH